MDNADAPTTVVHHHHHHRHDGTIHHHHHTHSAKVAPPLEKIPQPPRLPSRIVNNSAVLSAVRDVPCRHLGSVLYTPNVDPADSEASSHTKLDYETGQYSIPRREGRENCTLTVRIPRFYLSHDELLHTCARRAVWGTDIYTDDSDPLCAVIHGGWIRGAWPPDVDINMLEPDLRSVTLAPDAVDWKDTVLEEPPAESPMIPPTDKDLHVTLLILPALQAYASRVSHGVKSRAWGADHDGLSFRIERIAWVDEKSGKAGDRSAVTRKERLRRLMSQDHNAATAGAADPALKRPVGGSSNGLRPSSPPVKLPAAMRSSQTTNNKPLVASKLKVAASA